MSLVLFYSVVVFYAGIHSILMNVVVMRELMEFLAVESKMDVFFLFVLLPAQGGWTPGDVNNFCRRQLRVDRFRKILEIARDLFRRFARPEIIAARPEQNHFRLIWQDHPVGKMRRVHNLRAAEAAVHDRQAGEILRQRFPPGNGRGTGEDNGIGRWRVLGILHFKGVDGFFPARKIMRPICSGGATRQNEQAKEQSNRQ